MLENLGVNKTQESIAIKHEEISIITTGENHVSKLADFFKSSLFLFPVIVLAGPVKGDPEDKKEHKGHELAGDKEVVN